jgi:hypothetical protein
MEIDAGGKKVHPKEESLCHGVKYAGFQRVYIFLQIKNRVKRVNCAKQQLPGRSKWR